MTMIDDDELRRALRDLAADAPAGLTPAPELVNRVRRGGARRLAFRRVAAAGGMAAVVAAVGVGLPVAVHQLRPPPAVSVAETAYAGWQDAPTSGDLAGDRAYLRQVVVAWKDSHARSVNADRGIFDDLRGETHVVWAGTTPAGRAALVTQRAYLHRHANLQIDHEGLHTLVGFLGTGPGGQVTVVGDDYPAPGYPPTVGWFADPARRVLVVAAAGERLSYSPSWTYRPDGTARRDWTPLAFRDGAAIVALPAGVDPGAVRLTAAATATSNGLRLVAGVPVRDAAIDHRLPWGPASEHGPGVFWPVGGADAAFGRPSDHTRGIVEGLFWYALSRRTEAGAFSVETTLWHAYGATADGRRVIVGERQLDGDASRSYAAVDPGTPAERLVDGGPIDPRRVLPVAIHLPAGHGWVVAQKGATLRYAVGAGPWRAAGRDAAALPEEAGLRVEVAGADGKVTVVRLPR